MINKIIRRILPAPIFKSINNYTILSKQFGQYDSMKKWSCIDANNQPIPWYTYPAIEYIKQLDFTDKNVFEFGSGNSTIFWANRCKSIIAVEDDRIWYEKIKLQLPPNVTYLFEGDQHNYINAIQSFQKSFDIIIVDGSHRHDCAIEAIKNLAPNGIVVLDNADWHPKTATFLRENDLIEVDMTGFGPINDYTWTTSFFLRRSVQLKKAHNRQPMPGIGGIDQIAQ
jgi:hypothetical protein